jgi:murein DD-endopeptidase MepM/ murein hydrolase activator NlpD
VRDKTNATRLGRPAKPRAKPLVKGIRPGLFYGIFAALFATNILTLVGFLLSPDIAALVNGQNAAALSAYQDRIAQLRLDVDRLHSRQYAQTGDINLQLQELAQQQEVLTEQHQYVKALADKAAELGITPVAATADDAKPTSVPTAASTGGNTLSTSDAGAAAVEQAGHQVREMMDESRTALAAISAAATTSTDQILDSLKQVGIKPDLPDAAQDVDGGVGGHFIPAEDSPEASSMVDDANAVLSALARFKDARTAIAMAPVHMPVTGPERISSVFGNRTDPFTGRQAFHPGIDFPWPTGTTVLAAGHGKVIFVGQINGYGNVVDIDHGGGIVTRYGHLSAFLVDQGVTVDTGTPIARVGSTGRSTGPHLHFEVRRNDSPVDPTFYLAVGKRLARFLTGVV